MSSSAMPPREGDLPKGLWVGTAVFAVIAAVVLAAALHLGREQTEAQANAAFEAEPVHLSAEEESRVQAENAAEIDP